MQSNGVAGVWQVAEPKNPTKVLEIITPALDVDFAADGMSIFTAGRDGSVRRWSAEGKETWRAEISPKTAVRTIGVSPDGSVVAAGGDDGKVHILTVRGVELGSVDTGQEMVLSLNFSAQSLRLACDGSDTRIRIFRRIGAAPGIELERIFREPNERYAKMLPNLIRLDVQWGWEESTVFAPDGTQVLTANLDGTCEFWTIDGKRRHHPFSNHGDHHIRAVAFSPLGNLVASGGFDGKAQLWTTSGTPAGHPLTAHNDVVTSIAFSPDGKVIATAGMDGTVRFWNPQGERLGMLPRGRVPLQPRTKSK
jgi:WD40 repeat protein